MIESSAAGPTSMSMVRAHQLLHGYSNGHRRLAGSLRLSSRDDELVSRISDLSGPLLGGQEFQPYFTGYPLPSGEYYAVARTWIDSQAPRAGSVLTHTLLISMMEFGEVEDIEVFFCLLEQKPRRNELWHYEEPLGVGVPLRNSSELENVCPNEATAVDFVEKYFGEGERPILWLDVTSPEKVVRLLFGHLWPQMRCHFAFCTLSLQLRNLDDRPFDILFAPSNRRGKHHQVGQRNIVGAQPSEETQIQRWEADFARAVFLGCPRKLQFQEEFAELWQCLEPDPTVVPRLYRLRELKGRVSSSPMAAVGVMDLLASLTPKHNQAISLKAQIVSEGVESSSSLQPVQALKSLYLINDRLRQTAFLDLDAKIFKRTENAVSRMTQEAPDAALEIGKPAMQHEEAADSPYVIGVAKGLSEVAIRDPRKLLALTPSVVSIPVLIVAEPMIAIAYYDVTRSLPEAEKVSKELAEGFRYVKSEQGRRRIRNALLPKVSACGDSTALRELLYALPSEDVGVVLDHVEKATSGFSIDVVRQLVIAEISEQYSDIVREWGHGKRSWSFGIAAVVAASFTHSLQGLEDVLVYNHSDSRQALLLAAFIGSQNEYRIPEWLQDRLRSDSGVFNKLLVDGIKEVSEACAVVKRVLVEVPGIPFVLDDSLFDSVIRLRETQFGDVFVDTVMGRVVAEYVNEPAERQDFARWVDSTFGTEWFKRVPYQRLLTLLVQRGETTMSRWSQSWSVLRYAPDTLYTRRPPIIDDLVGHLLNIQGKWTEKVSYEWVALIQRAGKVSTRHVHLTLCAQALDYSLRHPEMPLNKVVVETFPVVYRYTLKDSSSSWLGSLFYLFSDWDKGKELRQQVVKSFLKSDWPPEDLALAMPDQQTFRKIFKRVRRYASGEHFMSRMLAGLKISDDPKAAKMYNVLSEMVESPDFDEPWI